MIISGKTGQFLKTEYKSGMVKKIITTLVITFNVFIHYINKIVILLLLND